MNTHELLNKVDKHIDEMRDFIAEMRAFTAKYTQYDTCRECKYLTVCGYDLTRCLRKGEQ